MCDLQQVPSQCRCMKEARGREDTFPCIASVKLNKFKVWVSLGYSPTETNADELFWGFEMAATCTSKVLALTIICAIARRTGNNKMNSIAMLSGTRMI